MRKVALGIILIVYAIMGGVASFASGAQITAYGAAFGAGTLNPFDVIAIAGAVAGIVLVIVGSAERRKKAHRNSDI